MATASFAPQDQTVIEFEVADIALALPVIRRVLTEAEAPPDTTIRQCEPEVVIHRLSEEV